MENLTYYAPVVIPTLCRYEHFKRCVESLSRCTHANNTEIYIGLDYPIRESHWEGYRQIKSYLPLIKGFSKVHIIEREENLGPSRNMLSLYDMVFSKHDRLICTEDDNEFSPNFLDYMNKGFELFKDTDSIYSVNGYNYPIDMSKYMYNHYFSYEFSGWGFGYWRDKRMAMISKYPYNNDTVYSILKSFSKVWRIWRREPRIIEALISSYKNRVYGDTINVAYCILENKLSVFPRVTKVRNHGHDGSGFNCTSMENDIFVSQRLDDNLLFNFDDVDINDLRIRSHRIFFSVGFKDKIRTLIKLLLWNLCNRNFKGAAQS